jgi:hypothetical protein
VREEPPVLGVVQRDHVAHPLLPDGPREFAHNITLRPHPDRIPLRELAVPHREAIVVLTDRAGKLCACLFEQCGPLIGIKLFTREQGIKSL